MKKSKSFQMLIATFLLTTFVGASSADWNGSFYEQNSAAQERWFKDLKGDLEVGSEDHILDIGCGSGGLTAILASQAINGKVIGMDSSASMIEWAQSHHADRQNIAFSHADARLLPFTEKFDLIVSFSCFHWIQDQERVFKEIKKALTEHGKFLVMLCASSIPEHPIHIAAAKVIQDLKWVGYFDNYEIPIYTYPKEFYEKCFSELGFSYEIKKIEKIDYYSTVTEFKDWLEGCFPYLTRVPTPLRSQFLDDVIRIYIELNPELEKSLFLDQDIWVLKGSL